MDDDDDSAWLKSLQRSFTWEVRSLGLVVLGVFAFVLETDVENATDVDTVGSKILEYTVLTCFLMDSYFSVVVTAVFLKPVIGVLREGRGLQTAQKSLGYKRMKQTRNMTLFGSSLAVLSSTYLYINLLLFFDGKTSNIRTSEWLNPLVASKAVFSCSIFCLLCVFSFEL